MPAGVEERGEAGIITACERVTPATARRYNVVGCGVHEKHFSRVRYIEGLTTV